MNRFIPFLLLILSLIYSGLARSEPITGHVIDDASGDALPGVSIRALLSGTSWLVSEPTDNDGAFRFDLTDGFDDAAMDTNFLNLEFTKAGYHKATRMRSTQIRGQFIVKDLRVRLEPKNEPDTAVEVSSPTDIEDTALTPFRRIFHRSYDLFGAAEGDTDDSLANLNRRLPRHLRRGIITHLQQLQLPANITFDPIPDEIKQGNSLKLRAFAHAEDALAVILGEAELTVSDGDETVELASEYRIIPLLPDFQPGSLFLDDRISKDDFSPSRLSRSLSKTWGGTTVFALALYEAREAMKQSDQEKRQAGLERAEAFLKAQKSVLGIDDNMLNQQIDALLELIRREGES
jgi:5-hydroxyisourate hydrolase-like protein (transthyretin family)